MHSCTLNAPGKINLYLEITSKRPDNYHSVVMVLQSVELGDRLHVKLGGMGIHIECDSPTVPTDASNLAYKAAALLQERSGHRGGVGIRIEKRIPVGAGMAGGSADAAAVLVGLNQLWNLGLTIRELQDLAAELGSDIPFCVAGGTMLATGRGEQLSPLTDLNPAALVIAKPRGLSVSTAWAYQNYRNGNHQSRGPISQVLSAIAHHEIGEIGANLYNDLESVVLPHHSAVADLKTTMQQADTLGVMMSGSGPTVFALMPSDDSALELKAELDSDRPDCEVWVTRTSSAGISLESIQSNK